MGSFVERIQKRSSHGQRDHAFIEATKILGGSRQGKAPFGNTRCTEVARLCSAGAVLETICLVSQQGGCLDPFQLPCIQPESHHGIQ